MPRPLRIEFENACYHVMNRGRGRQTIFHSPDYYHAFLTTLDEASRRFGLEIHAYCLMGNHYHLLLRTPRANLARCMRHINGLYTQRYNRLRHTDGPLFRGRYKSILVDADTYFLPLTRYIHRNPIETNPPLVPHLKDYAWSSYPAYTRSASAPQWLAQELTHELLGRKQKISAYRAYVEQGIDDEIAAYYSKIRLAPILGTDKFINEALKNSESEDKAKINKLLGRIPAIDEIVAAVSQAFDVATESIIISRRGRHSKNIARWMAVYLCREIGDYRLQAIAEAFGMSHSSGVNQHIKSLRLECDNDEAVMEKLKLLTQYLTP